MTHTRFIALALAGCLSVGIARAQDGTPPDTGTKERPAEGKAEGKAIDAAALLEKLAKQYSGYEDYYVEINKTVPNPMAGNIDIPTKLHWKKGNKIHSVMSMGFGPVQMTMKSVSDGKKGFTYQEQSMQGQTQKSYSEVEPSSPLLRNADPLLMALLDNDMKSLDDMGMDFKAEEVTVEGKTYERLTSSVAQGPMTINMSWDFVKDTGELKSALQTFDIEGGGGDPRMAMIKDMKVKTTFDNAKSNQGLADDLFAFTPPADANKVEPGAMGGMGGMGGGMGNPFGGGGGRRRPAPPAPPAPPKEPEDDKEESEDF